MMTASSGSHIQPQERVARAIPHRPSPFGFLLAQEQLTKFRAPSGAALRGVETTPADAHDAVSAGAADLPHHR